MNVLVHSHWQSQWHTARSKTERTFTRFPKGTNMGLFDSAFEGMNRDTTMNPQEAFAGILLGASACDGHISNEEAQGLGVIALRMKMFQGYDGNKFSKRAVGALPDELAETAFAGACDLTLADQGIEEDEKQFLHDLRIKLGIERDQAQKIFKVIAIKNRG
jgi:hypothetical protein